MTNTHYIVVRTGSDFSPAYAIRCIRTGFIVERGFRSASEAHAFIANADYIGGYPEDPEYDF
jgi:hypothetical protein